MKYEWYLLHAVDNCHCFLEAYIIFHIYMYILEQNFSLYVVCFAETGMRDRALNVLVEQLLTHSSFIRKTSSNRETS